MEHSILLENLSMNDINPRICGFEDCEPGHSYGPAARDYMLLHYVQFGQGIFETEGKSYQVKKGEIFVIHPGEVTCYRADTAEPWSYCWIGFESRISLPKCLALPVLTGEGCEHIFQFVCHLRQEDYGLEWRLLGKIYELLWVLIRRENGRRGIPQQYVNKAKNYMESSYISDISVEKIAYDLGLDRSYFSRIFKESEGVSPGRYLVSLRLERAAELLVSCDCSPSEAASRCGYSNPVNFSRMFKRQYGISPSKYGKR